MTVPMERFYRKHLFHPLKKTKGIIMVACFDNWRGLTGHSWDLWEGHQSATIIIKNDFQLFCLKFPVIVLEMISPLKEVCESECNQWEKTAEVSGDGWIWRVSGLKSWVELTYRLNVPEGVEVIESKWSIKGKERKKAVAQGWDLPILI